MIQTVLGLVSKDQLGFCHSHEHLFLADGQPAKVNPVLRLDEYNLSISELKLFKSVGGQALIDAQPLGCGRMEKFLAAASKDCGVNIVASTGFHKMAFYDKSHWIHSFTEDQLSRIFIRELTEGMFVNTDHSPPSETVSFKAGNIKVAYDTERQFDHEKKWFVAAAHACIETGFPIMCHVESTKQGMDIAEFFIKQGVPPHCLIICHMDRTLDELNLHRELAEMGIYLEYDTIGRFKYHSDEEEAELIVMMEESGLSCQILIGLDTTRARMKNYGGHLGLDYIQESFIPLLKKYGLNNEVIHQITVVNPAEAFSKK
ncbi:phosphotriesterase family protein [Peribacillus simplex]